ncbi:uncharacterized protein V6R79_014002 [Siganus canaliculatus]
MRFQWTVTFISTFVSMGLLVIIVGQHQMLATLNRGIEKQHSNADELDKQHVDKTFFKSTVEKLVAQGMKTTVELEATVAKLIPEMETKKTESDTCDTEKKTKNDELAAVEKEHADVEAKMKEESNSWAEEITTLKGQLTEYRPACDFVKRDSLAEKLCGAKP